MMIKKIFTAAALFAGLSIFFMLPAYADEEKVPGAELRAEADGLDISNNLEACYDDIERLHNEGVRLFDTAGLLNAEEKDAVEKKLDEASDMAGFDVVIVTATDISGYERTTKFSDDLYYYSDMGVGDEMSGALLVIETYGDGSSHISTSGEAIRYLTDSGIDYIYDDIGGGVWNAFKSGDYYNACLLYAEGIEQLCEAGVGADQYNIDENGQTDYYYQEKRSISPVELIISAIIAIGAGALTISSVKKSYAMRDTAAARGEINKAYLTASGFAPAANVNAVFVNKIVTRAPIPRPSGGSSHGSGHGGGASHTHTGGGGHSFGGGGRGSR